MRRLRHAIAVMLVLGAPLARAAGPTVEIFADAQALVSASGLTPPPPGVAGPVSTIRRQTPDGAQEMIIDAGNHEALHFGIGLTQLFTATASAYGYARGKGNLLQLSTAAGADLNTLRFGPPFVGGKNPLLAYAYVGIGGTISEVVTPPPLTGQPIGSPTSLTIHPRLLYEVDGGLQPVRFGRGYLTNYAFVQLGLWTLDGQPIDVIISPYGSVAYHTFNGLTSGTPIMVNFSASITSASLAGNDLPLTGPGYASSTPHQFAAVDALHTAYMLMFDANGEGVVGESGIDYGQEPTGELITTTTSTTTTTTFSPPTTLPSCAAEAYCGDGVYQPECGEACDCPQTATGEANVACVGDAAVPPFAQGCAVCAGCQVDLAGCGTTSTTASTSTSTSMSSTTIDPGCDVGTDPSCGTVTTTTSTLSTIPTTTTLPSPAEACGDCQDDDGDGLVDREDPDCCSPTPQTLVLTRARIVPAKHLSFDVTLRGAASATADLAAGGLIVQLRVPDGPALLCLRLPALVKKGKRFTFRDRSGSHAGGITGASLRMSRTDAVLHVEGRDVGLAGTIQPELLLTLGFGDGEPGRCGAARQTLRRQGKHGALTFP